MWSKFAKGLLRRNASSSTRTEKSPASLNTKKIVQPKSSPFKQRYTVSNATVTTSLLNNSFANSGRLPSFIGSSMSSWLSNIKFTSLPTTSSAKNCWNTSWSSFKFVAPAGSRQTHFEAIRSSIMQKYGSLGNSILLVLSAIATDAVFWWLAELLLDDGM
jgi:hypothetical protein